MGTPERASPQAEEPAPRHGASSRFLKTPSVIVSLDAGIPPALEGSTMKRISFGMLAALLIPVAGCAAGEVERTSVDRVEETPNGPVHMVGDMESTRWVDEESGDRMGVTSFDLTATPEEGAGPLRMEQDVHSRRSADGVVEYEGDTTVTLAGSGPITMHMEGVMPPTGDCRLPTSGTMTTTLADGTTSVFTFGPGCGEISRDGEPVDPSVFGPAFHE
jgi:hypothetical protein